MATVTVELGARSYPIDIGSGVLTLSSWWEPHVRGRAVAVVTNDTIAPLYGRALVDTLAPLAARVVPVVLPDGEAHKTWTTLNQVFDALLNARCDRDTLIVALGGGVVGDLAGFAAATYQRGIEFIQVPTTLLAQVDSSVGGKTGINHPSGKNMIGAFHQPRAVLIDVETLASLPDREYSAGLAEIIKHGAACDADYFEMLESEFPALLARHPATLADVIAGSCRIKARVVSEDERESGLRAILNFGHTFGHAIEAGMGYGAWLHGEAVGAGMVAAAELSVQQGTFLNEDALRLRKLIGSARLPIRPPSWDLVQWQDLMERDKKAAGGKTRFVLLKGLGQAYLAPVPEASLARLFETLNAPGRPVEVPGAPAGLAQ
ncbi:MAG: 3-dehydroquinate synthase [Burkholderiaceae bacterium]|jgi:3-dehydroquinate synthase